MQLNFKSKFQRIDSKMGKRHEQLFTDEKSLMSTKYMKRYSTLLVIREMQLSRS